MGQSLTPHPREVVRHIGAATLGSGMIRGLVNKPEFPPEIVLASGLYFTTLLALIFIPAQHTIKALGEELAEQLSPRPVPIDSDKGSWKDWSQEQMSIEAYLGVHQSPLLVIQSAVSVLAPLVGSVSTLVLVK